MLKAIVNCLNMPNVGKTLPKFQNNYNWMLKGTKAENNFPKDTKNLKLLPSVGIFLNIYKNWQKLPKHNVDMAR